MSEASSPFSANIPNFQIAWDSTSLGWIKDCAYLYKTFMIDQLSPRSRGIHLAFGGWYAQGCEHYAHYRAEGSSHDDATLRMVRYILEASGDRVCVACGGSGEDTFDPDDRCGQCFGSGKGDLWVPWSPGDHPDANIKNRYTLIRSLVWNCEDRLDSPFTTVILANGKPAVELTFNFDAFDLDGETISLSGHIDELVEANGQYYVKDDKTTKGALSASYFRQYTPHNQMSLYATAGRVILDKPIAGVIIRAAQIGVNFTRFATGQAPRPRAILDEWLADTKWWVKQAREYAIAGYWPRNDKSCDKFGGCPLRAVCGVSPSHRQAWLDQDFEHHEWNPLQPRGEL